MNRDNLRRAILSGDTEVRSILLTKPQRKLLSYIKDYPIYGITSKDIKRNEYSKCFYSIN